MSIIDPYKTCPAYETRSFRLRLVEKEDAKSLLSCYSDKAAVVRMNTDYCTGDFYYTDLEQMNDCIDFWLREYNKQAYVRFAIIPKTIGRAVGTVEIFGGEFGVLRIDIAAEYEKEKYIGELIHLAIMDLIYDFKVDSLKIKASNTPERILLLKQFGFIPDMIFRPELGYYERMHNKYFDASKGVAYCGLACCVCSENITCAGCRNEGCKDKEWCKSFNCCKEKGKNGCWECADFPCDYSMLKKLRVRTFAKFIAEHGEEKLMQALGNNESDGILYHYRGQLVGDYDLLQSEDEINKLIIRGL